MTRVRPYPGYRDSGVDWLGALPESWSVSRVGFETWVRARLGWKGLKADEYVDDGYLFLSTPDIKGREIDFSRTNRITEERYRESPEIMLRTGDVLLAKDGSTLGTVNLVTDLPAPATVNSSIAVLTPRRKADGAYVRYLLSSEYMKNIVQSLKGGMGVPHLFQWDINRIKMPLPPLGEQRQIATFLDRETAKIDALIGKQEQLIETLRERRDAVWANVFDQVASASTSIQIRRVLTSIVDGPFGSSLTSAHYSSEGTRVIRLGNIGVNEFRDADAAFIPNEYGKMLHAHSAIAGDVVIAGLGDDRMPLGRAAVVPDLGPAIVKADCYRARPNRLISSDFLAWALSAPQTRRQIGLLARGATRARLNTSVVQQVIIPVPNADTQSWAVEESARLIAKVDVLIEKAQRFIVLSKERRSALISAAVTGQVDVRGEVTVEGVA